MSLGCESLEFFRVYLYMDGWSKLKASLIKKFKSALAKQSYYFDVGCRYEFFDRKKNNLKLSFLNFVPAAAPSSRRRRRWPRAAWGCTSSDRRARGSPRGSSRCGWSGRATSSGSSGNCRSRRPSSQRPSSSKTSSSGRGRARWERRLFQVSGST